MNETEITKDVVLENQTEKKEDLQKDGVETKNANDTKSNESNTNGLKEKENTSLKHVEKSFIYDVMSQPTYSGHEYRLVTFITMWARKNDITCEFDDYGNIYLTKGSIGEGEFYPCVTSHLDTVQSGQKVWAEVGLPLNIDTKVNKDGKHEMHVDGMGIGADCKSGVAIALSLFKHFDTLKACFFLEEETGCLGSKKLAKEWFNNVGYVIGWDSPELNRAAWCCSGVKLFDKDFFEKHVKDICKQHGLTIFNSEPYTDVKEIRLHTDIICMNFGNGGYLAHSNTEYCILEDMDTACGMGIDLIKHLGKKQYKLQYSSSSYGYYKTNTDGTKVWVRDNDNVYFEQYSGYKRTYTSANNTSVNKASTATQTSNSSKQNTIDVETIKYVSDVYEEHISDIKNKIENKCKELGIDFKQFQECFETTIKF